MDSMDFKAYLGLLVLIMSDLNKPKLAWFFQHYHIKELIQYCCNIASNIAESAIWPAI